MSGFEQALKAKQEVESMHSELQSLMAWSKKQKQRDKAIEGARGKRQPVDDAVTRSIEDFAASTTSEAPKSANPAPKQSRSSFSLLPKSGGQNKKTKSVHSNATPGNNDTGLSATGPSQPATPRMTREVRASPQATATDKPTSTSSAASNTTAVAPNAESAAGADKLRECGNMNFRKGNYEEANAAYTASIAACPNALALSNRAMVALKLERWLKAEEDATAALALDESYCKAWQRRAAARIKIGGLAKALQAVEDLEHAVRLQPDSSALATERAAAVASYHKLPGAMAQPSIWRPIRTSDSTPAATATSNRSVNNTGPQQPPRQQHHAATPVVAAPDSAAVCSERCAPDKDSSAPTQTATGQIHSRAKTHPGLQQQQMQQQAQKQQQQQLMHGCHIEEITESSEAPLVERHLPTPAAVAEHSLHSINEHPSMLPSKARPEVQGLHQAPSRSPASAAGEACPRPSAAAAPKSTTGRKVTAQVGEQHDLSVEGKAGRDPQQGLPLSSATDDDQQRQRTNTAASQMAIAVDVFPMVAAAVTRASDSPTNSEAQHSSTDNVPGSDGVQRAGSIVDHCMDASSPAAATTDGGGCNASVSPTTAPAPALSAAAAAVAGTSAAAAVHQNNSTTVARSNGSPVAAAAVAALLKQLDAPKSGADFERTWRMLSHHAECQAGYLAKIAPSALPSLLRTQLTAPLLESLLPPLLEVIRNDASATASAAHALKILAALPDVPRFALAAMLVSPSRRQTLSDKWEAAEAAVSQTEATNTNAADAKQLLCRLRATFRL